MRKKGGLQHTDAWNIGDRFAVVKAFNGFYLHGDEDVIVGSGSVFSGSLSEDCGSEGRTNAPDTRNDSRLSFLVGDWEFGERYERSSLLLTVRHQKVYSDLGRSHVRR